MNIAINGFGRIGRAAFKALLDKKGIRLVAINDLTDTKTLAHLFKYDSCYGIYKKAISAAGDNLLVDGKAYRVLAEKETAKHPSGNFKVYIVFL